MARAEPRARPKTVERFMVIPTSGEWAAELASGWPGPDGSSMSTDTIMGVRIGRSSMEYLPAYPANLHDYRYRVSRRMGGLPELWRLEADRAYRDGCEDLVMLRLTGWRRALKPLARWRCSKRYAALRSLAGFAWEGGPK